MKNRIAFLILILTASSAYSQKIKYKEVFPLLYPNQTQNGIELLRTFLEEEKNHDEAHANYQFGEYFLAQFYAQNFLLDTAMLSDYGDSAKMYLDLGNQLIDEKELKKNDDYYQSFYRRDLRTGEFGIKLSDVHLDIEEKIKSIDQTLINVRLLHERLSSMQKTHQSQVNLFNAVVNKHDSFDSFLFQLDDKQLEELSTLIDFQKQITQKTDELEDVLSEMNKTQLLGKLELRAISDFKALELILDPYQNNYVTWDFEEWFYSTSGQFRSEVEAYKTSLQYWDEELNQSQTKLDEGISGDIQRQLTPSMIEFQKKYDPSASMMRYLSLKSDHILLNSLISNQINPNWLDTSQVALNAMMADSVMVLIDQVKMKFPGLTEQLKSDANYYTEHIDKLYGGISAITKAISGWEYAIGDVENQWRNYQNYWNDRNTWVSWQDTKIAIDTTVEQTNMPFYTMMTHQRETALLSVGVQKTDSSIFVMTVKPDRTVNWFNQTDLKFEESDSLGIMPGDPMEAVVMSYHAEDSLGILQVIKIDTSGQLLWKNEIKDVIKPHHINWDDIIDQYTFYFFPEERYPLSDGTTGYMIIDKNGENK
jgi:hypothetical protein